MARRRYNQYCPVAYALDLVGERWTLLIVRELLLGPRRFTDLLRSLPGIGPNLLSQRLKALEQQALVAPRTLPPPAGSAVYELTEAGRGLGGVVRALSLWGGRYLTVPRPAEEHFDTSIAMSAAKLRFRPENAAGAEWTCEVRSGNDPFHVVIRDQQLDARLGPAPAADLILRMPDLETFPQLIAGFLDAQDAVRRGLLALDVGDVAALENFLQVFE